MKIKCLIGAILIFASSTSFAFQTKITDTYVFGDGDSKASAKEILVERIKRTASNKAGMYIQKDSSINSEGYKESIKTISAAIVSLEILSEKTRINRSGSVYLRLTANAKVDEKELKKRILAIQSDRKKDESIRLLTKENSELLKIMSKLESSLKKNLSPKKRLDILSDQSEIYNKLIMNRSAVSNVFKKGNLISLAVKAKEKDQEIKYEFQKEYERFWKNHKILKPEIYSVKEIDEGRNYEVVVKIPINPDMEEEMIMLIMNRKMPRHKKIDYRTLKEINAKKWKTSILNKLEYISDKGMIYLYVDIVDVQKKINFFGRFEKKTYLNEIYSKPRKNFSDFRAAAYGDKKWSSDIFDFIRENPRGAIWKRKDNDFFVKIKLTKEQAALAEEVKAYFK